MADRRDAGGVTAPDGERGDGARAGVCAGMPARAIRLAAASHRLTQHHIGETGAAAEIFPAATGSARSFANPVNVQGSTTGGQTPPRRRSGGCDGQEDEKAGASGGTCEPGGPRPTCDSSRHRGRRNAAGHRRRRFPPAARGRCAPLPNGEKSGDSAHLCGKHEKLRCGLSGRPFGSPKSLQSSPARDDDAIRPAVTMISRDCHLSRTGCELRCTVVTIKRNAGQVSLASWN